MKFVLLKNNKNETPPIASTRFRRYITDSVRGVAKCIAGDSASCCLQTVRMQEHVLEARQLQSESH